MNARESSFIPYGRQTIDQDDIDAVVGALASDWLTTGPLIGEFEAAVAAACGARHGVAVSSGTAGLHAAMAALRIDEGDEVIVPALTFAASANAVLYQGGVPVFCDVDPESLLIDPQSIAELITERTAAVVAVDYTGQPADYPALRAVIGDRPINIVADACHSIGGSLDGQPVGTLADLSVLSFHPVKHVATGEGGMILTNDDDRREAMARFRNHGISSDHRQRSEAGTWRYDMVELGYNYRLTDIQCALGLSQLAKLEESIERRRGIAAAYDVAFADLTSITPLAVSERAGHAYHLYVVRIDTDGGPTRDDVYEFMRSHGIGVNVHYTPVHLHDYYQQHVPTARTTLPNTEKAYEQILTLPMFPALSRSDVDRVIDTLVEAIS